MAKVKNLVPDRVLAGEVIKNRGEDPQERLTAGSLAIILRQDENLMADSEKKMLFTSYANLFDSDLVNNLGLTSIELDGKYNTRDSSSWRAFVRHPLVKKYVDGFLEEQAEKIADNALAGAEQLKPRDALRVKETMQARNRGEDNSHILVVFLPQKDYTL